MMKVMKQTAKIVQFSAEKRSGLFEMTPNKEMNEIRRSMEGMKIVNSLQMSLNQ